MKLGVKTTKTVAAFMHRKITFYVGMEDLVGGKTPKTRGTKYIPQRKERCTVGDNGEPSLTDWT
jgi:hypothetical protein